MGINRAIAGVKVAIGAQCMFHVRVDASKGANDGERGRHAEDATPCAWKTGDLGVVRGVHLLTGPKVSEAAADVLRHVEWMCVRVCLL